MENKKYKSSIKKQLTQIGIGSILYGIGLIVLLFIKPSFVIAVLVACVMLWGVFFIFIGIETIAKIKRHDSLHNNPKAFITDAKYISCLLVENSKFKFLKNKKNNEANFKVIYEYNDKKGIKRIVTSLISYSKEQVAFLKAKKVFKVKCIEEFSTIIEDV